MKQNYCRSQTSSMVLSVSRVIKIGDKRVAYLVDITPLEFLDEQGLGEGFIGSVLDIFLQRGEPVLSHSLTEIATELRLRCRI